VEESMIGKGALASFFFFFFRYRAGPLVGVVALLCQRITWLGWQVKREVGQVAHRIKLFTRA
jgi:hypothetical protein